MNPYIFIAVSLCIIIVFALFIRALVWFDNFVNKTLKGKPR